MPDHSNEYTLCPFRVVIDTREQAPFTFQGLRTDAKDGRRQLVVETIPSTLATGDYSIEGLEELISIERKSVSDFYGTILAGRDRFERELQRLQEMAGAGGYAEVVCEGDWFAEGPPLKPGETLLVMCPDCHGCGEQQVPVCDSAICRTCNGRCVVDGLTSDQKADRQKRIKTVYRSVIAWKHRYPLVKWERWPSRRDAERYVFRTLERFWAERERERPRPLPGQLTLPLRIPDKRGNP